MSDPDIDEAVLASIADELAAARAEHGPIASAHEGYAVILEELDELWAEVRKRKGKRDLLRMEKEARQVAAMAARFIADVVVAPHLAGSPVGTSDGA